MTAATPKPTVAQVRQSVNDRHGPDPLADDADICGAAAMLAGNPFVCIAAPHPHVVDDRGLEVGHRWVHDYRNMPRPE